MKVLLSLTLAVALAAPCVAQDFLGPQATGPMVTGPTAATLPTSRPATRPTTRYASPFHHMKVDVKARTITIEAEVVRREGLLELVLCQWDTKDYESLLRTKADPSGLHAALLLMGLTPGKPARSIYQSDTETSLFLPPRGAQVALSYRWTDKKGVAHEAAGADWLELAGTAKDKPAMPKAWVFVGSDLTSDGQYFADTDGNMISLSNFPSSVVDVPFESSAQNVSLDYQCRTKAIPELGTKVSLVLKVLKGGETADHARVIIEIDRMGRYSLDGKELPVADMREWAMAYLDKHKKGEVTLRVDGRAMAYDIARAKQELRMGGVFDAEQVLLEPPQEAMPRTARQAQLSLEFWARRFEHTDEFIREPTADAQAMLKHIQQEIDALDDVKAMWLDYQRQFERAFKKYQASTRPAK